MRILPFALALVVVGNTSLSAQVAPTSALSTERSIDSASLISSLGQAQLERDAAWEAVGRGTIYTLGFGLVGGGLGYFASQVAYSDWDKIDNSTFSAERRAFSITGAALGAVTGFFLSLRDDTVERGPMVIRQELGRDFITMYELEQTTNRTLYDAIQNLRPEWLRTRGMTNPQETGSLTGDANNPQVVAGAPTIKVYMDNAYLGGVDALRDVSTNAIQTVRRLDAAEATTRWGAGHLHGAIAVESINRGGL